MLQLIRGLEAKIEDDSELGLRSARAQKTQKKLFPSLSRLSLASAFQIEKLTASSASSPPKAAPSTAAAGPAAARSLFRPKIAAAASAAPDPP